MGTTAPPVQGGFSTGGCRRERVIKRSLLIVLMVVLGAVVILVTAILFLQVVLSRYAAG